MAELIYSLCDFTGEWCRPYREAGYEVIQVDLQHGEDVRLLEVPKQKVKGVLAAPPCTAFAASGAQYWKQKDVDGRTLEGLSIVDACLRFIMATRPDFWALENPVGRLRRWLGEPRFKFDPCDFGDPWTKKTLLWGEFQLPAKNRIEPERTCPQGSWLQRLPGQSAKTKILRSTTPAGFAKAFFEANR